MSEMPSPVTYAADEVEQIRVLIREYIDQHHCTVTEIAATAELPRDFLYRFLSGSYQHSPKFEDICRLLDAIGYRLVPRPKQKEG